MPTYCTRLRPSSSCWRSASPPRWRAARSVSARSSDTSFSGALKASGFGLFSDSATVATLAELGVVFLLFDIGLHFSLAHVREQARDIFGFGPVQVVFSTVGLGALAMLAGLAPGPALLVGATLAPPRRQ